MVLRYIFRQPLDWRGTAKRPEFWLTVLFCFALQVAFVWMVERGFIAKWVWLLLWVVTMFPLVSVSVRRLHDMARSGVWAILVVVPVLNIAFLMICAIVAGKHNQHAAWVGKKGHLLGKMALMSLAVLALSRAFWTPYTIPSGNMKPTLLVGDYLVTTELDQGNVPKAGEVYVFSHPVTGQDHIMRLIGVPGDLVQMQDGSIILNGEAVPQLPDGVFSETMERQGPFRLFPRCENGPVALGDACHKGHFIESLPNGVSYPVLNIATQSGDDTGMYTVPEGHYFLLGDNRDNSNDSRIPQPAGGIGFVPRENLSGRAVRVVFSSTGRSPWFVWAWRPDRILVEVQ